MRQELLRALINCRYKLVKSYCLPQHCGKHLRGNRGTISIVPDYTGVEIVIVTQVFEFLQEKYTE